MLKGLSLEVNEGELYCMVGGNRAGKTTALSVISGIKSPYRGTVKIKGKKLSDYRKKEIFNGLMGGASAESQEHFRGKLCKKRPFGSTCG